MIRRLLLLLAATTLLTPTNFVFGLGIPQVQNVLMIGVDDLRTNLGAYGESWTSTPNLDRLASMGMKFTRAYAPQPICNPSRAAFLSGLYPETSGVLTNNQDPRAEGFLPDTRFLPEVYQDNGYFTATIGKLEHRRHQGQMDVDEFENPDNTFDASAIVESGDIAGYKWQVVDAPDSDFGDGKIADRVVELLGQQPTATEPFFIHAGFKKPHQDYIAPQRFFDAHPATAMPLMPQGIDAPDGTRGSVEGRDGFPELTDTEERQIIASYAAATSFMDSQVGRVMDAMDEHDLWDTTAVVFYSDHGFSLGDHGHWGKANQFESSARIPFIVVTPGVEAGSESDTPIDIVDIFPTMMELSGLQSPHALDGDSIVPVLEDPDALTDGIAYSVFGTTSDPNVARVRSIRTPDYSYIRYFDGTDVLFAADDVFEETDLSVDPDFADVLADMQALLANAKTASVSDTTAALPEPGVVFFAAALSGLALARRRVSGSLS
ncbi:MAG: sulfatase [Planctomycetota bacterium]